MKTTKALWVLILTALLVASCDNDSTGSENDKSDYDKGIVAGYTITSDTTWSSDVITVNGQIVIEAGASLTIAAGTTVKFEQHGGDVNKVGLIITKAGSDSKASGKLIANGTASNPIIFTSNSSAPAAGDWGGIILVGEAYINTPADEAFVEGLSFEVAYGRQDRTKDNDNSGSLKYVVIEYCGFGLSTDSEVNGLSLYACGSETVLDFVQVYKCTDDGFEFFGGKVNASHLVSMYNDDDSFDADQGWSGNGQFWLAVQAPGADNGFEMDGRAKLGEGDATSPNLYNISLVGFGETGKDDEDKNYGMRLREDFTGNLHNILITNFAGINLKLENDKKGNYDSTEDNYLTNGTLKIDNILVANNNLESAQASGGFKDDTQKNQFITAQNNITYINSSVVENTFMLKSSITTPTAKTTSLPVGIISANYIGAFDGTTDWTSGWARKND